MASVRELTDMLKAVEEAHAGLADIEAGRAEPGKDKRASLLKSGIQKLKESQQHLTEAAVQKASQRHLTSSTRLAQTWQSISRRRCKIA